MTRGGRLGVVALALAVAGSHSRAARADMPEMSLSVDSQRVGVGDVMRMSVHVMSRGEQPSNPLPGTTTGFTVLGSSSGPSQQVMITNGRIVSQRGLDATWTLRADKVGTWSLGPVTVQVGSAAYRVGPVRVTVVAASQAPPRPAPDPFDPFSGFSPFGGGHDPLRSLMDSLGGQQAETYGGDPKLALETGNGSVAFLHATADTTSVVVGQQVTVSMYLYVDATVRDPGMVDVHEATAADFLKRTLYEDDNTDRTVSRAMVGGHLFNVRLLRKWALFPLHAGDLAMTPMDMTLQRSRSTGDPSRKSEVITVHVTEPPADHRPPGYQLGDVGSFQLHAEVSPRDMEEDGAVGVTLTLDGTGNLPAMITPPAAAGLEWLTPEVHEKVGAAKGDRFGGSRTFAYVLRLHRSGDVRLGAIALPYWDPTEGRYETARADLGVVTSRPSVATKTKATAPPDPFSMMPELRDAMGATRLPEGRLAESHPGLFWFGLGATPFAFLGFTGVSTGVRSVRARVRDRASSPLTDLRTKLAVAEAAARSGDARAIAAATARALQAAIVVHADVNVRDALDGEVRERIAEAGVDEALAGEIADVLAACEAARFSPDAPDLAEAEARFRAAKAAIVSLARTA